MFLRHIFNCCLLFIELLWRHIRYWVPGWEILSVFPLTVRCWTSTTLLTQRYTLLHSLISKLLYLFVHQIILIHPFIPFSLSTSANPFLSFSQYIYLHTFSSSFSPSLSLSFSLYFFITFRPSPYISLSLSPSLPFIPLSLYLFPMTLPSAISPSIHPSIQLNKQLNIVILICISVDHSTQTFSQWID